MSFQITALDPSLFSPLFTQSDAELMSAHALRITATKKPGFPCRVSLEDADVGEEVLLVHYEHLSVDTPFKGSHAVYIRPGAKHAHPERDEVPELFRTRLLSLRGWTRDGMLAAADVADGKDLELAIAVLFSNPTVEFIHLHYAKPGCYAARVDRA